MRALLVASLVLLLVLVVYLLARRHLHGARPDPKEEQTSFAERLPLAERFVPTYPMPCRDEPWPLPNASSGPLTAPDYGRAAEIKSGMGRYFDWPAGVLGTPTEVAGLKAYDARQLGSWYAIDNANWTDFNDSSGTKMTQNYSEQSKVSLTGGGEAPSLRPRYQVANPVSGIGITSNQRLWSDPLQDPRNGPCSDCRTIFELPPGPGFLGHVEPDTTDGTIYQGRSFYSPMAGLYDKTIYRKMGVEGPYDMTPTYPNINLPPYTDARDGTADGCLSCVGDGCGACWKGGNGCGKNGQYALAQKSVIQSQCSVLQPGPACSGGDQGPTIR